MATRMSDTTRIDPALMSDRGYNIFAVSHAKMAASYDLAFAMWVAFRRILLCFAFSLALAKRLVLCLAELLISITDQFVLFGVAFSSGLTELFRYLLKG